MVRRRVGEGGHSAWSCLSVSKFGCAVQLSPVALSCSIRGGKRSPPGDLLQARGDGLCPELCGRACFQSPERPSWPALLPQPGNPSPVLSMAGSECWEQSSQGPCLPQAFQELSSEVTVTILGSEEYIAMRAFLSGDLIRRGIRVHRVTKDTSLHDSAGFGEISTVTTVPPVEHTGASMKMRTFGGRLSSPDTLVGLRGIQGGATGISSFLGSPWAADLGDRASRRQQSKAGLFRICQLWSRC